MARDLAARHAGNGLRPACNRMQTIAPREDARPVSTARTAPA